MVFLNIIFYFTEDIMAEMELEKYKVDPPLGIYNLTIII